MAVPRIAIRVPTGNENLPIRKAALDFLKSLGGRVTAGRAEELVYSSPRTYIMMTVDGGIIDCFSNCPNYASPKTYVPRNKWLDGVLWVDLTHLASPGHTLTLDGKDITLSEESYQALKEHFNG